MSEISTATAVGFIGLGVMGEGGVAAAARAGSVLIDFSTIPSKAKAGFAARTAARRSPD